MNQPLAPAAGNAVEVRVAVRFLSNAHRDARLEEVTVALVAEMLGLARLAATPEAGAAMAREALDSGRAAERFGRMVHALGGPADFLERFEDHLPEAPLRLPVRAEGEGIVEAVDTRAVGLAVVRLGGGRSRADDPVDPAVGFSDLVPIGTRVAVGDPIAVVHAGDSAAAQAASEALMAAISLGPGPVSQSPAIRRVL